MSALDKKIAAEIITDQLRVLVDTVEHRWREAVAELVAENAKLRALLDDPDT